jgi:enoyl-CoA hydratase/carnithine racemase
MSTFSDYGKRYGSIALERSDDGVLTVMLHNDGGPFITTRDAHRQLAEVWFDIAADRKNRVVVVTGAGDSFCTKSDPDSYDKQSIAGWDSIRWEGERMITGFLDVEVPVIAAINGPISVHPGWPFTADIVIASETTYIEDATHFVAGSVAGDGNHIIWDMLLGPNRARYFLMMGQRISAAEALASGLVGEVLAADDVLPRALEIAHRFAQFDDIALRATRRSVTLELRRRIRNDLDHGLLLEGMAILRNNNL